MARCTNKVSFHVESGYGFRKVEVQCGRTNPWGNRTICEECENNAQEMKSIRQHEKNIAADNASLRSAGWGEM
tara:strand:- start:332 stop:550 length:219 start_codon:yes stop_codon:yes gene_type:complete